jgi:hypothetical protein
MIKVFEQLFGSLRSGLNPLMIAFVIIIIVSVVYFDKYMRTRKKNRNAHGSKRYKIKKYYN